jgi:hypothetical protein
VPANVKIEVDMSQVRGFRKIGMHKNVVADGLKLQTLTIAARVAKLARERLSVSDPKNIGVTGKASGNIHVVPEGATGAGISEGPYPANFFIREGRAQGSTPPPIKAIIDWISAKGISVKVPPSQKGALRWTKKGGARADSTAKPSRPFKRDMKHIASLIAYRIGERGQVHFSKFHPTGSPRYDYYSEILTRTPGKRHFVQLLEKTFGSKWIPPYVTFLRTGSYSKRSSRVKLV